MSIQERWKTLEHAVLEAKLAEARAKRKLELLEKSFQYQKQKIENEALIAIEKVLLFKNERSAYVSALTKIINKITRYITENSDV